MDYVGSLQKEGSSFSGMDCSENSLVVFVYMVVEIT